MHGRKFRHNLKVSSLIVSLNERIPQIRIGIDSCLVVHEHSLRVEAGAQVDNYMAHRSCVFLCKKPSYTWSQVCSQQQEGFVKSPIRNSIHQHYYPSHMSMRFSKRKEKRQEKNGSALWQKWRIPQPHGLSAICDGTSAEGEIILKKFALFYVPTQPPSIS